jgi:5-methylcytosine-specific restriction endonuclease McrA
MTELATKIIELRNQGKTYTEIKKILKCSKATISYYINPQEKINTTNRRRRNRAKQHPYIRKIENFSRSYYEPKTKQQISTAKRLLQIKTECFSRTGINRQMYNKPTFTVQDVINKFGEHPKCALTGDEIDIYQPRTYEFDHIIPVTRGGTNNIDNLQLCTKKANQAKRNMTDEEFINLCKKIVNYQKTKAAAAEIESA